MEWKKGKWTRNRNKHYRGGWGGRKKKDGWKAGKEGSEITEKNMVKNTKTLKKERNERRGGNDNHPGIYSRKDKD